MASTAADRSPSPDIITTAMSGWAAMTFVSSSTPSMPGMQMSARTRV